MKEVQSLLFEGNGRAARNRLSVLIGQQPDKTAQAAQATLKMLGDAYDTFHFQGVQEFCAELEMDLPAVVAEPILGQIAPRIQRTGHWQAQLLEVARERLVRECRRYVVTNAPKLAVAAGVALFKLSRDPAQAETNARYLARGLAELYNDRERAAAVVQAIQKAAGSSSEGPRQLISFFQSLVGQLGPQALDGGGEQAWQQRLNEALLSLRAYLPNPNEVGEPPPEQIDRFAEELHAIMRGALQSATPQPVVDALTLWREYCPVDAAAHQHIAGVEERMFVRLGPRARLVAVRSLRRLGENETLCKIIMKLANSELGEGRVGLLATVMGALRHPDFFAYLKGAIAKVRSDLEERPILDALGRIGTPEAAKVLIDRLDSAIGKIGTKGGQVRAREILVALGRLGRQPDLEVKWRNQLVKEVTERAEKGGSFIAFEAASQMFSNRPEELDPRLRAWAARHAVELMWGQPVDLPGARGGVNGWREPMVLALKRLGPAIEFEVIEAAQKRVARYSGAMRSLANALEAIGSERSAGLLETMTRTALLHTDDPNRSKLLDEREVDAASGELRDLNRDDVVHTLLYTLTKIGGQEGLRFVMDLADQAQAGRLQPPGDQTASFLVDTKVRHGKLGELTEKVQKFDLDEKELRQALGEARGGLLTKKSTRIAAIALLGQARRAEAIETLLEGLGDKDPMVASAAHTALAQFMHPLPGEKEFCQFLIELLGQPKNLKGTALERLIEFIRREMPKNKPYDHLYARQVAACVEDETLAHRLMGAIQIERPRPSVPQGPENDSQQDESAPQSESAQAARASDLEKKRAYLQARREWIAGGKKGDPPGQPM